MIQQKLEDNKREAESWSPEWNGDTEYSKFEVSSGPFLKYGVELKDSHCACRKWDLTGIPCCHAIACMWYNRTHPENFVLNYYK